MPSYCGKCGAEQVAQHSANNAQAEANAAAAEFLRSHGRDLWTSYGKELNAILELLGVPELLGTDPDDRKEAGGG